MHRSILWGLGAGAPNPNLIEFEYLCTTSSNPNPILYVWTEPDTDKQGRLKSRIGTDPPWFHHSGSTGATWTRMIPPGLLPCAPLPPSPLAQALLALQNFDTPA